MQWRRVGGSIEVRGNFTVGTTSPANQNFTLPNGLIPNVGWSSGDGMLVGYITRGVSSEANTVGLLARNDNTIRFGQYVGLGSNNNVLALSTTTFVNTGDFVNLYLSVPIQGWGSTLALSSDAGDGRVVAAKYNNATITSTVLNYQTLVYDTHNSYSAGVYTAPISGYYRGSINIRGALSLQLIAQINESSVETVYDSETSGYAQSVSFQYYLLAGQRLRFTTPNALSSQISSQSFTIERIGTGSQIIAPVETVACSYYSASTQTSLTTQINFGTRLYDTHGAVTTGASWRFTAPMSGTYLITGQISFGTANIYVQVYRDNALLIGNAGRDPGGNPTLLTQVYLLAGQYIDIRPSASTNVNGNANLTSVDATNIQISRIGI
jgi:hypothetical protein